MAVVKLTAVSNYSNFNNKLINNNLDKVRKFQECIFCFLHFFSAYLVYILIL